MLKRAPMLARGPVDGLSSLSLSPGNRVFGGNMFATGLRAHVQLTATRSKSQQLATTPGPFHVFLHVGMLFLNSVVFLMCCYDLSLFHMISAAATRQQQRA